MMPLNTLRLNHAPSSHPNDRIVFIKPLPRPSSLATDYQTADTLLRAIAAQCLPVMKSHHLSVTTLEEHEPNSEFIGRNFNNGEVIQLVLRGKSGGWLPINMIQMVMMHELAHNLHMNHGRDFWKTRNLFAQQMKELWTRGYTGDGLWSTGRMLGEVEAVMNGNTVRSEELKDLPLCGGTFRTRSRRKKRQAKDDTLSWREKKQRRIEKKFGKNGLALGVDEEKRLSIELSTKGPLGVKPRVAQSKRGRDLRVAAALARFETNKKEVEQLEIASGGEKSEDETASEDEDTCGEDARGLDGRRLVDGNGNHMIKVCEGDDKDDVNIKHELDELWDLEHFDFDGYKRNTVSDAASHGNMMPKDSVGALRSLYDIPQHSDIPSTSSEIDDGQHKSSVSRSRSSVESKLMPKMRETSTSEKSFVSPATSIGNNVDKECDNHTTTTIADTRRVTVECPICSLRNDSFSSTCVACTHVLDRRKDPRAWTCSSNTCRQSSPQFVNAGDTGICGVCAGRKSTPSTVE